MQDTTPEEETMPKFPQPERREIRNSQGYVRTYVRYPGQSHWYRDLATAQIAFQRAGLLRPEEPTRPDKFQTAFRTQYPRHGRRYSLRIDGELYAPVEFDSRPDNPNNLNRDARIVAARVAEQLGCLVEVVKHLATEDRVEGHYGW